MRSRKRSPANAKWRKVKSDARAPALNRKMAKDPATTCFATNCHWDMSEVHLKKGEPVDKALRRLKKKLDREQTLIQVRLHRRFEKPSARKRKKQKAARFAAMLKARYADY